jgi:hypothetical protein
MITLNAMKSSLYLLLLVSLLSCKHGSDTKTPKSKAEIQAAYLRKALATDDYKNAAMNVERINKDLDSVKKGTLKPVVVIFIFNNSLGNTMGQVDSVSQVEEKMKKDTDYLRSVQLKAAADLARADSAKMKSKVKH